MDETGGAVTVRINHALFSALGFVLFLNALALSSVSVDTVMGAEYFFANCDGDEPSTVDVGLPSTV